jgi:predicted phosphodiesterase
MKIAILSDLHGNCIALDAVLANIPHSQIDAVVCLGDAIQGGPQPAQVTARLIELGWPIVMGNADDWMLTGIETGEPIEAERLRQMHAIREWSLSQLSEADQAFIRSFKPTITLPIDAERRLLCFHGSPASYDELILPKTTDAELLAMLGDDQNTFYCGGHTHMQQIRHLGRSLFFNPGSVGFAWRHNQEPGTFKADPWAEYAILTIQGMHLSLEFRRIPFDVAALIEMYQNSGRPFADVAVRQYQDT